MECRNKEVCKKKHERWKEQQQIHIPKGEKEHEEFLNYVQKVNYFLEIGDHSSKRQFERSISSRDITDIILNGWVIERSFYKSVQAVRLTILGYTRTYRPIHVIVQIKSPNEWSVVTVYNPESKAYKWDKSFQERICFC